MTTPFAWSMKMRLPSFAPGCKSTPVKNKSCEPKNLRDIDKYCEEKCAELEKAFKAEQLDKLKKLEKKIKKLEKALNV